MTTCTICATPQPPTADTYACTACTYQLAAWLREIPEQLPRLREALVPGSRPAQGHATAHPAPGTPLCLDVADLLLHHAGTGGAPPTGPPEDQTGHLPITTTLHRCATAIAATHPAARRDRHGTQRITRCTTPAPRHGTTPTAWCAWLLAYLPYATTQPTITDLHHDLRQLIDRIRAITRTNPGTRTLAAPCPRCQTCALVQTDGSWHVACRTCRHRLSRDEYASYSHALATALDPTRP